MNTEEPVPILRPYKYRDLLDHEDTRVLTIAPGVDDDPISCTLSHITLSDKPEYECLSYTWGDVIGKHALCCEDGMLEITANLQSALRRLRYSDRPRTMWVDAICINQEDIPHRNAQVEMMRNIYAGASTVVVWLGDEVKGDKLAFEFFHKFQQLANETKMANAEEGNPELIQKWEDLLSRVNIDSVEAVAVSGILQRPWFRRVWVIQEVAMSQAAVVVCGALSVDWVALASLFELVETRGMAIHLKSTGYILRAIDLMTQLANPRNSVFNHTLIRLLEVTQIFSSSEPADRIFALFSIASDVSNVGLSVDYKQSCEDLYRKFALHQLLVQKNLHSLPSWVPDVSKFSVLNS